MIGFQVEAGQLLVEDVPLAEVAQTFGTPTFVYSHGAIADAYRSFVQAFETVPHRICYAVKANSNLAVLTLLDNLGAGFDIVSGGELQRVIAAGIDPARVVFSGVGKQTLEIEQALQAGIHCFNVESTTELEDLIRIATHLGKVAPVSIRVNPDVDAGTHPYISTGLKDNKFGVSIDIARTLYRRAAASSQVHILGIDCHIGSQILELAPFQDAFTRVLALMDELKLEGFTFEHIDLGGGLGVRYRDEEPVSVEEFGAAIVQQMGSRTQELVFEPGRYIVANAGVLLCRVIQLKENEGKRFAIVDAAMNDLLRPSLYGSWQDIQPVNPDPTVTPLTYDVVGPVCETGDFLGKERTLAITRESLLAIMSSGAYGFVMSSNYNSRGRAAEVLVRGNEARCVRRRETISDLLQLEQPFKT